MNYDKTLAKIVARLLMDPVFAKVVYKDPFRFLKSSGIPRRIIEKIGQIKPYQWTHKALTIKVFPGNPLQTKYRPPSRKYFPSMPHLPNGKPLEMKKRGGKVMGQWTQSVPSTLFQCQQYAPRLGIKGLENWTHFDRVGLPVFAVKIGKETGFAFGKGKTISHAKASAYMEAFERLASEIGPKDHTVKTTSAMREDGPVVTPSELGLIPKELFDPKVLVEWTKAWDLLNEEWVWIPLASVQLGYQAPKNVLPLESFSNGLASGNTPEEAICNGLAELIERDAETLKDIAHVIAPIARTLAKELLGKNFPSKPIPSHQIPENLDLQNVPLETRRLIHRFEKKGVHVSVLDMTSDLGIPSFEAVVYSEKEKNKEIFLTYGSGTHPIAAIALERALTEAAQQRVGNFEFMARNKNNRRKQPQFLKPEYIITDRGTKRWKNIPKIRTKTVREDLLIMLASLRRAAIRRCLIKDLTQPDFPIPVYMVVVPELENWSAKVRHQIPSGIRSRGLSKV